ncbi:MAG TPA: hypothetical protein GX706_01120 [Candidatus Moranbacteria bacterium]|nr:hypothetical protein [Candidatus Moranbacteria bacterium]
MNSRYLTIILILILTITTGGLFWYGERKIEKTNQAFTAIGFESLNDESDLTFFIDNRKPKNKEYSINYLVNENLIESEKITIPEKSKKIITPNDSILKKIKTASRDQETVNLEIIVKSGEKSLTIERGQL